MEVAILIFCCIRNYSRARAANLNAALWSFYTFIACFLTWSIGGIIMSLIMISRDAQLRSMLMKQPLDQQQVINYLMTKNLLIPQLFLLVCLIGGYLLTRHMIIKRTTSNS